MGEKSLDSTVKSLRLMPYISCTNCGKDTFMSAPDSVHTIADRNVEHSDNIEVQFNCDCGTINKIYWHNFKL